MLFKKYTPDGKLGKLFVKDKGAIAIITALVLTACVGFAALAIDVGVWHSQKRNLQMQADAGAAGGAFALAKTGSGTVNAYVTHDLALSGCTSGGGCTAVIHTPPISGAKTGDPYSVEVILSKPAELYLSGLFLGTAPTIKARAVAGQVVASRCIITLGTTGQGLTVNGTASINAVGCGVQVNSGDSDAVRTVGGGTIIASPVNVVGGVSGGGIVGTVNTGAGSVADPLASVTAPLPSSTCTQTNFTSTTIQTINPGTYCGGIRVTGGTLTLNSGIYYMVNTTSGPLSKGDFNIAGGAIVNSSGAGVTIIMTQQAGAVNQFGTVDVLGGATLNLSPLTAGPTENILFFGDRNSSGLSHKFAGGNTQILNGILYFPTAHLDYAGNQASTANPCFQIIAESLTATGTTNLTFGCAIESGTFNLFE